MIEQKLHGLPIRPIRGRTFSIFNSVVVDALIVLVAYIATFSIRTSTIPFPLQPYAGIFIVLATVITLLMMYLFGVYHFLWSSTSGYGVSVIFYAVGAATIINVSLNTLLNPQPIPRSVELIASVLILSGFIAVRYRSRIFNHIPWQLSANSPFAVSKDDARIRVLIIGAGDAGQELACRLKYRLHDPNYKIVGFIDDDQNKQGLYVEGCPVLGGRQDIIQVAEAHKIDLIVMAIHNIKGPDFRAILEYCEQTKARIKVVPDVMALMNATHSQTLLRDVKAEDLLGRSIVTRHKEVDMTPVTGKTVLVTGAAGSIGSELSRQLCTYKPVKLLLLDVNESGLHDLITEIHTAHPNVNAIPILADITIREDLQHYFDLHNPQLVFHAAAYKHVPMLERYPEQAVKVNIGGTRNLAEIAQAMQVERFVMISTDKAVNPTSVMGASKRICEMLIQAISSRETNTTLFTTVRFGNVLDSRGSVVPIFSKQINMGGPVTVTHPEMTRYFMSIPEAVNLVIHAACLTKGNEIFLLKMGEVVRILDLAERMIRMRGMRPHQDIKITYSGIRPGEKLHEQLYDGSAEQAYETIHPGIIRLDRYTAQQADSSLLAWADELVANGIRTENALKELSWGLTPSEEYAAQNV